MPTPLDEMPEYIKDDRAWIYRHIEIEFEQGSDVVLLTSDFLAEQFDGISYALVCLLVYGFAVASRTTEDGSSGLAVLNTELAGKGDEVVVQHALSASSPSEPDQL